MTNQEAIDVLKRLTKGLNDNGSIKIANDMAIKALENAGCGCAICLAHNGMKCPLIEQEAKEVEAKCE